MPTNAESVCCKEIQQVCAVINEEEPEKRCITELTSFAPACLQRTDLRIAFILTDNVMKKYQRAMGDFDTSVIDNLFDGAGDGLAEPFEFHCPPVQSI